MKNVSNRHDLKEYLPFIMVCIAMLIYIIYWSWLSLYRLFTFQTGVYDLGTAAQEFYIVYHQPFFSINTLAGFLNRDIMYIFSPLTFFDYYQLILIIQTIFLSLPAILIYFISMKVLKRTYLGVAFSLVYLMYPLLAGVNWFDFHNQAFFIFFFLLAFYLFIDHHYRYAAFFFIIAGMTHYLFLLVVILFGIPFLIEAVYSYAIGKNIKKETLWGIFILIISLFLFGLSVYINDIQNITVSSVIHNTGVTVFSNLSPKFMVMLLAIVPFAFLSLIPNRYWLLVLPFILLVFFSANSIYYFPGITMDQYASLLIPGIFISTIYSIDSLLKKFNKVIVTKHGSKNIKATKIIAVVMVLLTAGSAVLLEPYGPLNHESPNSYDTERPLNSYLPLYSQFNKLADLIPGNATSVVIGDGEPTAIPRPQIPGAPLLVTPYNIASNMSYESSTGKWVKLSPQYIIGNPYNVMFTLSGGPDYNLSMYSILSRLYSTGEYGILGEASGMILLEKNYSGPIKYFVPIQYTLFKPFLTSNCCSDILGNSMIFVRSPNPVNLNSSVDLNGPIFLPPGRYSIVIHFNNLEIPRNSTMKIFLRNGNGKTLAMGNISANYATKSLSLNATIRSMTEFSRIAIAMGNGVSMSILNIEYTQDSYS